MSRDDGRAECQAVGCAEPATAWGLVIDQGGVDVELRLCRRHESDVFNGARMPEPEIVTESRRVDP
jgi:hypothetical protein